MSQSMKFNVPNKIQHDQKKYTEEKVTVIMKLTAIKLLMLCMFAASPFFFF